MVATLEVAGATEMFLYVSDQMVASADRLTQADQAIGDGDHGVGMARGFEAVRRRLEGQTYATLDELLQAVGMALLTSIGGAAGVVFGTLFRGSARNLGGKSVFDSDALAQMLDDGLRAVQQRGHAVPGDKTVVDALEPAARTARELSAAPLDQSLPQVAEAARQGMEATTRMIARVGKAKTLGERSLGYPDPGALSTYLMLTYMADYVSRPQRFPFR